MLSSALPARAGAAVVVVRSGPTTSSSAHFSSSPAATFRCCCCRRRSTSSSGVGYYATSASRSRPPGREHGIQKKSTPPDAPRRPPPWPPDVVQVRGTAGVRSGRLRSSAGSGGGSSPCAAAPCGLESAEEALEKPVRLRLGLRQHAAAAAAAPEVGWPPLLRPLGRHGGALDAPEGARVRRVLHRGEAPACGRWRGGRLEHCHGQDPCAVQACASVRSRRTEEGEAALTAGHSPRVPAERLCQPVATLCTALTRGAACTG